MESRYSIFFVNCSRTEILIIFWGKNYQTALFSPLADFLTIIDPTSREVTEIFPNMRNELVPSFFLIGQATGQTSAHIYCLPTNYDNSESLGTLVRSASFCEKAYSHVQLSNKLYIFKIKKPLALKN